jgi:hypothetical protein
MIEKIQKEVFQQRFFAYYRTEAFRQSIFERYYYFAVFGMLPEKSNRIPDDTVDLKRFEIIS